MGQHEKPDAPRGRVQARGHRLFVRAIQPPTGCSHVHAPLEALKIVERVKGIEAYSKYWVFVVING